MIINIRGVSGSGKTHAMRGIMEGFPSTRVWFKGRDKVAGMLLKVGQRKVFVVGSYREICGGCDTIKDTKAIEELVSHYAGLGRDVLFEGLFISGSHSQWIALADRNPTWDFRVVFLSTKFDVCVERVRQRRLDRGNDKPWKVENMRDFEKRMKRQHVHFQRANIPVYDLDVDSCILTVREWLTRK